MKRPDHLQRRTLLAAAAAALGAGAGLLPGLGGAASLSGIDALDTAAIRVRRPGSVLLEAIALAGNRLVAVGQHGVIIYSDDEGKTWVQATVLVDATLTCVGFASPMVGWAAGHFGVVLNTIDAGKTWQVQLNGIQVNQLTLAAAQAAASDNDTSPGAPFASKRAALFQASGASKPFLGVIAFSAERAILFGAYRMAMVTNDGGKTWADMSLRIGDRLSHNLYGSISIGPDIYLVGEAGMVFRSTDGGGNFAAVTSPSEVTLFGALGAPDGRLIAYGVAGNAFQSADRGNTWTQITVATQDNITAGCTMKSGAVLLATESGSLFVSKDNGISFRPVVGARTMSVFGLLQNRNGDMVFVGASGATEIASTVFDS